MCVLVFAWRAHPRWPLVVAGNRDELHARPAAPLARWDEPNHLIAGRDLQSGGTWLGISERRRFAVVTNLGGHGPAEPARASRGALVTGLLSEEGSFNGAGDVELADFNPFNLIFADHEQAWLLSNRPVAVRRRLAPGIYGLANGGLDDPWPRTVRLKAWVHDWMGNGAERPEVLLAALADEKLADEKLADQDVTEGKVPDGTMSDEEVANAGAATPPPSPVFLRNPVYGTRCSTVVAVDDQGAGIIVERRYGSRGEPEGETDLRFSWAGSEP